MSNWITTGSPEAQEKLTARFFWRAAGGAAFLDAGNVKEYADATSRSLVTASKSRGGARHVGLEQVDVNHEAWTFLLDERDANQNRLIQLARRDANREQPLAEGASATLENVSLGRWHDIGANGIANVIVTGLAGVLEEGADYQVDRQAGRLLVMTGGEVAAGEDLVVTFDQPGIAFEVQTTQVTPLFRGDVMFEEVNQFDAMALRVVTFTGNINVIEFPQQTGEVGVYRVKATPDGPVTVLKRPRFETLPVLQEDQPGASSSSSSQSSSASSASSSSSTAQSRTSSSHSSSTATSQSSNSSSSTAASNTSSSEVLSHSSMSQSSQSRTDSSLSSSSSSSTSLSTSSTSAAATSSTSSDSGAELHYRYIDANIYVTRGQDYEVGDILYIPGGVYEEQAGVTVIGIDPYGGVVGYQLFPEGDYSVIPGEGDFNLVGGHGTGAKALNVYWETFTP